MGNQIFLHTNFKLKEGFKSNLKLYFNSTIEILDFEPLSNAIKIVNNWVSNKTKGTIKNLLEPGK